MEIGETLKRILGGGGTSEPVEAAPQKMDRFGRATHAGEQARQIELESNKWAVRTRNAEPADPEPKSST